MRQDVLVYIAGPVNATPGHTVKENVQDAIDVHLEGLRRGIPSFCPHLVTPFVLPDYEAGRITYEDLLAYDFAVLSRCTHILLMPRWTESPGAVREEAFAKQHEIRVVRSWDEV